MVIAQVARRPRALNVRQQHLPDVRSGRRRRSCRSGSRQVPNA